MLRASLLLVALTLSPSAAARSNADESAAWLGPEPNTKKVGLVDALAWTVGHAEEVLRVARAGGWTEQKSGSETVWTAPPSRAGTPDDLAVTFAASPYPAQLEAFLCSSGPSAAPSRIRGARRPFGHRRPASCTSLGSACDCDGPGST